MNRYLLPNEFSCPNCGCLMDAAREGQTSGPPRHDDFCVCGNCAEFLAYVVNDGVYSLRKCTELDTCEAIKDGIWSRIQKLTLDIKSGKIKAKVRWPK